MAAWNALRECRLQLQLLGRRAMSTALGWDSGHFDGPPLVDYITRKNPCGVTPETVAHAELARRISRLKWCQDHLVVPIVEEWMAEGNEITRYGLIIVRHKLRRRKRFHHALRISDWIAYKKRVIPYDHKEALNHIDLVSRVSVTRAREMFDNLPADWKSREGYTVLLSMYVRHSMAADAESIYTTLKRWGLRSISPINMMLTLYQKHQVFWKVAELIRDAEEAGQSLNMCSFNILLPMTFRAGGVAEMESLVEMMESKNFLDEHTYCMLASSYGRAGMVDKAKEMLMVVEDGMETGKFNRLRRTYNVIIVIYGFIGDVEGVKRIWDITSRMDPTAEDYICMIRSSAKVGLFEQAESGFLALAAQRKMHITVCNVMLQVCQAGNFVLRAESLLRKIHQMGFKPDPATYHHLIAIHLKNDNIQRALDLFQLERQVFRVPFELSPQERKFMSTEPRKDIKPWVGTCRMMMLALAERGEVVACETLFRNWRLEKWKTDVRLFNALLRAYEVAREPVAGFMERLEADGVEADEETIGILSRLPERPLIKQLH
ncbi:hypothetical protein SELMODRAFT_423640 [Selaginella moellendorffii]|uniref:Pentacotripeptide-repeat region of PRORP domain-containing protein n=1 Tax=Selaginella moellendorffii TaxID=88036 RepID=D8SMC6_SELML|nr:pentatricopeptide repeat-containing protein At1g80270, mitochondrial [Selaginella moellendorffii]EFJ14574.1 hypothetical protein SELMODRAFT_423640 [Selaginella moellendorffii]|eukprot:XP_002984524.1 pentatricopeptide repeat-containing protein At1g80270, mitochondrial [Selaginella moellendorffii]